MIYGPVIHPFLDYIKYKLFTKKQWELKYLFIKVLNNNTRSCYNRKVSNDVGLEHFKTDFIIIDLLKFMIIWASLSYFFLCILFMICKTIYITITCMNMSHHQEIPFVRGVLNCPLGYLWCLWISTYIVCLFVRLLISALFICLINE